MLQTECVSSVERGHFGASLRPILARLPLRARVAHEKLLQAHFEPRGVLTLTYPPNYKGAKRPPYNLAERESARPISTAVQHCPSLLYISVSYLLLCTTSSSIIQANLLIFVGRYVGGETIQ